MKIRTDYVSNSSSSSFIIDFEDNGDCIDQTFMSLIKRTLYIIVTGECGTKEQYDELKKRIEDVFGDSSDCDDSELRITLDVKSDDIDPDDTTKIDIIKSIVSLREGDIRCSCGDDWGDDLCSAIQLATILECR